jgi:hypothetical protein
MARIGFIRAMTIVGINNTIVTTKNVTMFSTATTSQLQEMGTKLM